MYSTVVFDGVKWLVITLAGRVAIKLYQIRSKSRTMRRLAYSVINMAENIKKTITETGSTYEKSPNKHLEVIVDSMKGDVKHAVSSEILSTWGLVFTIWMTILYI